VYNLVKLECLPIKFPYDLVVLHHFPSNLLLTTGLKMTKTTTTKNMNTNILATTIEPFLAVYVFLIVSATLSPKYPE
jgi:hypothetical protein